MDAAELYLNQVRNQVRALPRVFVAGGLDRRRFEELQTEFVPHETRASLQVRDPAFHPTPRWKLAVSKDFEAFRAALARLSEAVALAPAGSAGASENSNGDEDPDLEKPGEIRFGPARPAENAFDRRIFDMLRGQLGAGAGPAGRPPGLSEELLGRLRSASKQEFQSLGKRGRQGWLRTTLGLEPYSFSAAEVSAARSSPAAPRDSGASEGSSEGGEDEISEDPRSQGTSENEVLGAADFPASQRNRVWDCVSCQTCCSPSSPDPHPPSEPSGAVAASRKASALAPELVKPSLVFLLGLDQVHTCRLVTELVEGFLLRLAPQLTSRSYVSRRSRQARERSGSEASGASEEGQGAAAVDPGFWVRCCPLHHAREKHVWTLENSSIAQNSQTEELGSSGDEGSGEARVFVRQTLLSDVLGSWLYALLARLELPLYPEMAALLRDLFRLCAELRSLQNSDSGASREASGEASGKAVEKKQLCDKVSSSEEEDSGRRIARPEAGSDENKMDLEEDEEAKAGQENKMKKEEEDEKEGKSPEVPALVMRCNLLMAVCEGIFSQKA